MNPHAISTISSISLRYIFSSRHRTEAAIHLQGRSSTRQQLYTEQMLPDIYTEAALHRTDAAIYISTQKQLYTEQMLLYIYLHR